MTEPARPPDQQLADDEVIRLALDYPDEYGPRYRAALDALDRYVALSRRVEALETKLSDIATRGWRDEGGRIAAAIARDALASVSARPKEDF